MSEDVDSDFLHFFVLPLSHNARHAFAEMYNLIGHMEHLVRFWLEFIFTINSNESLMMQFDYRCEQDV